MALNWVLGSHKYNCILYNTQYTLPHAFLWPQNLQLLPVNIYGFSRSHQFIVVEFPRGKGTNLPHLQSNTDNPLNAGTYKTACMRLSTFNLTMRYCVRSLQKFGQSLYFSSNSAYLSKRDFSIPFLSATLLFT